jgi:hypothetical protein
MKRIKAAYVGTVSSLLSELRKYEHCFEGYKESRQAVLKNIAEYNAKNF